MNYKTYTNSKNHRHALVRQVLSKFTDKVGGDAIELCEIIYDRFTVDDFYYHDDFNYFTIMQYFEDKVVPHKIEVFKAGWELTNMKCFKAQILGDDFEQYQENLWLHDISKLSAVEAYGYCFNDFSKKEPQESFKIAWNHHQKHNPHHPEYWHMLSKDGSIELLPMPNIYVFEMVADWIGAGKTYGSTLDDWLPNNLHKFLFHEKTRDILQVILDELGYNSTYKDGRMYGCLKNFKQ